MHETLLVFIDFCFFTRVFYSILLNLMFWSIQGLLFEQLSALISESNLNLHKFIDMTFIHNSQPSFAIILEQSDFTLERVVNFNNISQTVPVTVLAVLIQKWSAINPCVYHRISELCTHLISIYHNRFNWNQYKWWRCAKAANYRPHKVDAFIQIDWMMDAFLWSRVNLFIGIIECYTAQNHAVSNQGTFCTVCLI